MVLPSADDVWFFSMLVGAGILIVCVIVVIFECRQCQSDWVEDKERRRRTKLNGIADPVAIELIGGRPDSERPAGVDWSISMWAVERGEFCPTDRGFGKPILHSDKWSKEGSWSVKKGRG